MNQQRGTVRWPITVLTTRSSRVDIADFLTYAGPVFIVLAVLVLLGGVFLMERMQHEDDEAAEATEATEPTEPE